MRWAKRIADDPWLTRIILLFIVVNAIVLGMETVPRLNDAYGTGFHLFNEIVLWIFVAELAVKLVAYRSNYFSYGWNIFDFVIIVLSFIPAVGAGITIVRLLRLLRLLSLVPELRLIINTLLKSITSIGSVIFLLFLTFYIYAVSGVHLFATADPARWGSLSKAFLTLFGVLTLDEWSEALRATHHPYAWLFFVSFVFIAAFIVLNLFIAIIIYNLQRAEREAARSRTPNIVEEMRTLKAKVFHLEQKDKQSKG